MLLVDGVGHLPGTFTGRDASRVVLRQGMKPVPVTLALYHYAIAALGLSGDGDFRHLPVCEGGKVRGIVSRYDFRVHEHARLDEETGYCEILR